MKSTQLQTDLWRQAWFLELSSNSKLLFLYLISNYHTNVLSLSKYSIRELEFELNLTSDIIFKCLDELKEQVVVSFNLERTVVWIWVVNALKNSLGYKSKLTMKNVKGILADENIPDNIRKAVLEAYSNFLPEVDFVNTIPLSKREIIVIRDGFKCCYCSRPFDSIKEIHIDHIIPKSRGGSDTYENLVSSCSRCNLEKLDLMPDDIEKRPTNRFYSKSDAIKDLKKPDVFKKYRALFMKN